MGLAFHLLQKFLPFSKNMELLANRDPLWPILLEKACYDKRNQELMQDYFHIDPRNRILLLEKHTHISHFFPANACFSQTPLSCQIPSQTKKNPFSPWILLFIKHYSVYWRPLRYDQLCIHDFLSASGRRQILPVAEPYFHLSHHDATLFSIRFCMEMAGRTGSHCCPVRPAV